MRKFLLQLLKILISAGLVVLLLRQIGLGEIWHLFRQANVWWIAAAFILFSLSHVLGSFQWHLLLKAEGVQLVWKKVLSFYYTGLFFNNFLISGLGGDLFRMYDIRKVSKDGKAAVSTVLLDRAIGLFVMSSFSILSAPWLVSKLSHGARLQLPLLLLLSGWILILLFFFNHQFNRPFVWMIRKIIPAKIYTKASDVYYQIHEFGKHPVLFLKVIGISTIVQCCRILTHYLLALALGVSISPVYFFLFIPIIAIMAALPISMGGLGVREQTGVLLFVAVGMFESEAVSMEFLAYIVAVMTSLPGGLLFILRKQADKNEVLEPALANEGRLK